ncbi:hypothetical protein Nm8I071_21800 [Nonomuraea sp. TT08I-71]|nr:hypothetical protein Nm8I071_21800 [Nonomuraea sp. TT08I-71]
MIKIPPGPADRSALDRLADSRGAGEELADVGFDLAEVYDSVPEVVVALRNHFRIHSSGAGLGTKRFQIDLLAQGFGDRGPVSSMEQDGGLLLATPRRSTPAATPPTVTVSAAA